MEDVIIPQEYKYIATFLTMRCNLNCSFCLNSMDKSKEFRRERFKEISGEEWVRGLNRIKSRQDVPVTFSGGEPFLHKDFIYIINNLKPELKIEILTNLQWGDEGIKRFKQEVNPERLKRDSKYPSIRVSYHPEQMNAEKLVRNVKKLQDAGFSIGIYSVQYPSPEQLQEITKMQFRCIDAGILFRLKDFTGEYKGMLYGDYSKFPEALNSREMTKECECRTSELIIGPDGRVYRCHRDLYAEEFSIGSILNLAFAVSHEYRFCNKFGNCHPCDVKVKTNYKQELGHTSVEMKNIRNVLNNGYTKS